MVYHQYCRYGCHYCTKTVDCFSLSVVEIWQKTVKWACVLPIFPAQFHQKFRVYYVHMHYAYGPRQLFTLISVTVLLQPDGGFEATLLWCCLTRHQCFLHCHATLYDVHSQLAGDKMGKLKLYHLMNTWIARKCMWNVYLIVTVDVSLSIKKWFTSLDKSNYYRLWSYFFAKLCLLVLLLWWYNSSFAVGAI